MDCIRIGCVRMSALNAVHIVAAEPMGNSLVVYFF